MSIQFSGPIIVGTPVNPPSGVSLTSLSDTSVISPTNGQVLTYNSGGSVWQNQSIGNSVYGYLSSNLIEGSGVNLTFTPGSPGTVTIAVGLVPSDITAALGYSPINKIGDTVSGSYNYSGGNIGNLSYADFAVQGSPPSYLAGRVFYLGGTDQALCYYNDEIDVIMSIGQETWVRVRNTSGGTIANGTPVYISGSNSGLPTVLPANANSITTSDVVGLATHSIENNTNGYVTAYGLVKNINTNTFTPGSTLYLGTSAGTFTGTAPTTPNTVIPLGIVVSQNATTGSMLVNIRGILKTAVNTNITPAGTVLATNVQQAIYDLDTGKLARDGSQAMSAALPMGGFKITNVAIPTNTGDAATKGYVDAAVVGNTPLASCQAATTVALPTVTAAGSGVGKTLTATANGALTVDGYAAVAGNRILVKNQGGSSPNSNNGIYVVTNAGSGAAPFVLTRATDFDATSEVVTGATTFVENGTGNGSTSWTLITANPVTVDTTALQFSISSRAGAIIAGTGLTLNINTLSVNLGAGVTELPTNEVGVDLRSAGGLFTTVDGTTPSTVTGAQLAIRLDGTTLSTSASGTKVSAGGITATELNTSVAGPGLSGGAGTALTIGTVSSSRIVINSDDIDLATTGITAGNFNVVNVDVYGRATSGFLRSLTAPAAGITVSNATGVAGNPTLTLADDLAGLEGLATAGIGVRTATSTWATRSITVSGTGLSISNADGVAGNPAITSNATSANTASTLVARDGSGNFTAGTITAALSGNASSASAAPWTGITGKPTTIAGYGITNAITTAGGTITTGQLISVRQGNTNASSTGAIEIRNTGGTGDTDVACLSFHCPGSYAMNMHLRSDGYFGIGGWSSPAWRWYSAYDGTMVASGDIVAYSDRRLKTNILPIENALSKVLRLQGVSFTRKDSGNNSIGLIAQDVREVFPEVITVGADDDETLGVAYGNLIGPLVEAIRELKAEIDSLKAQIGKV
jgi:hypothetical protein